MNTTATSAVPANGPRFLRHSDGLLVLFVLGILTVLVAPIPGALLDVLILSNFCLAFLILLLTFHMARPVEFSTFPSLLLIATLFRLSLNVAATRLILSHGEAGQVIAAIGSYVVGGNYVIGLIIFLILIVVQYVVVTSGAQRVSEVAARFTLDSMPGQQMSIDADLNMGFIDQAEAQRRRRNIEKEAAFYGSMDGASKFVKGDAIAGILILLINSLGGWVIGVMQQGMPWREALQTYTLLTIGDGIVTQVPALVIAIGTGIIVTRSAADSHLSQEALRQISSIPKVMLWVGVAMLGITSLPGMPTMAGLSLGVLMLLAAWLATRAARHRKQAQSSSASSDPALNALGATSESGGSADPYAGLNNDPVEVRLSTDWMTCLNRPEHAFLARIEAFRQQYAQEMGFVLPVVRLREMPRFEPDIYEIAIDGVRMAKVKVRCDRLLAIHPQGDLTRVPGEPTRDPTYGLPALWIDATGRETAIAAGYTLVDPPTVLMTHLTDLLRREAATLLTRGQTEQLLKRVRDAHPTLVEELIPTVLSLGDVQKVLQNLLREKVPVRQLEAILETLTDAARLSKEPGFLSERVRQRLGQSICQSLLGEAQALHVITLDPGLESQFLHSLQGVEASSGNPPDAQFTERLMTRLGQQAEQMMKKNLLPVVLCSPELRRHLRHLSERVMPHLRVLSMAEIPHTIELKSFGVVHG